MRKSHASKKPAPKTKRTRKLSPLIIIPLIIITLFVLAATTYKIVELIILSQKDTFPTLEISLKDVPIEQIDAGTKDIKYPGNTVSITVDNKTTTYDDVEIKGRGNSTWIQYKKPYQIKFAQKENLFNLGEEKKWILLANRLDPSYLRNDTAFFIEKLLDEKYTAEGRFLDLYIDANYRGLYYLSEKIELAKSRVNLKNDLGILAELDNNHTATEKCFYTDMQNCIVLHEVVNENSSDDATKKLTTAINQLESALKKKDYQKITNLIDIDSFAKYFLISEFTNNPDAYNSSFFLHKDGEEDKLHAGPGWDFDFAFGNKGWSWVPEEIDYDIFFSPFSNLVLKDFATKSPETPRTIDPSHSSTFLYDLMDIPEFEQRVKEIYQETLSGHGEELLDYIKSQAEYIRPAALRDQDRWKLKTNFDEEVDYLIDWVAKRYDHFEQTYGAGSPAINSN